MAAVADGAEPRTVGLGAAVVPLLALAVFINYVDRGNLATAAPLIKDELHLSSTQIGLLLSAFFWSYMPGQLVAGWLAERINPYRTLALGLAIWSMATIACGLAGGFASLIVLRIVLGLGESAAFPCSSKLLAQHLPHDRLGAANGLIGVGLALGPAFGTFAGGALMAQLSWRPVFLLFGALSLLWLLPWLLATRTASAEASSSEGESAPSYWAILAKREAWGASLGHFANNYAFYFVISWLPLYLVKARGFSLPQMAQIGGLVYLTYAASSWLVGGITDRWMQGGASANLVRKSVICTGLVLVAAAMLVCAFGDGRTAVVGLLVAGFAFGFGTPNIFAIGQTLAGPIAGGKWVSVQNVFGSLAGIIAPIITGAVVDRTGQFYWAFVIAAGMALLGVIGWGLVIRKIAPVSWAPA